MTDLVLANSVQLTGHALVMLWLVNRLAPLRGYRLGSTTAKAGVAALLMALSLWRLLPLFQQGLPGEGLPAQMIRVSLLVGLGGGVYLLALRLLKTPELGLLARLFGRFLPGR
jgi:peptidoglycan biosynthesis protein MviN/MurJ (putative lipid II flippase)